jgi:hypothetical protein
MISFCKNSTTEKFIKLDDVLAYFNKINVDSHISSYDIEHDLKDKYPNKKELILILEKLIHDKYLSREYESNPDLKVDTPFSCRITYHGSLFSESGGYESENKRIKQRINWTRAKRTTRALEAITIIVIASISGILVPYNLDKKEEIIKTKEKEIKTLSAKVDSLTTTIQNFKKND